MMTPWGELADIDLSDPEILLKILSSDKHSLIEGAAIEHLTEDILTEFSSNSATIVEAIDVETIVVNGYKKGWFAFVWVKSRGRGLKRFLNGLEKQFRVFILEFDESLGDFITSEFKNGSANKKAKRIQSTLSCLSGRYPETFKVDRSVRNEDRTTTIYHGYLRSHDKFCRQLVLMRLLMNCGIQEHFRAVWNLDKAFIVNEDLWLIEIKHKYPIYNKSKPTEYPLKFGINIGELKALSRVHSCGIRLLHSILVKPYWDKETSSMHLFTDLRTRADAAFLVTELTGEVLKDLSSTAPINAGKHTSINGMNPQKFFSLTANQFSFVGELGDSPTAMSENLIRIMVEGELGVRCKDDFLHKRRRLKNT